jgi:hypothetical protein
MQLEIGVLCTVAVAKGYPTPPWIVVVATAAATAAALVSDYNHHHPRGLYGYQSTKPNQTK